MTLTLTIKNTGKSAAYTATIHKMDVAKDGTCTDVPNERIDLAAGESTEVTIWKGRELLITEKLAGEGEVEGEAKGEGEAEG